MSPSERKPVVSFQDDVRLFMERMDASQSLISDRMAAIESRLAHVESKSSKESRMLNSQLIQM